MLFHQGLQNMIVTATKPEILELIRKGNFKVLRELLLDWEPFELAELVDDLPTPENVALFRILPKDLAADVFELLPLDKQYELVELMAKEKQKLADILNELSPDDRTAFLEELPGTVAQRLLNLLSPEEKEIAVKLLGYPEDSIGRMMTTEYVAVKPNWTVAEALDHIRKFGKDSETLNVIYVVDDKWRLLDDLKIRELILADPYSFISDLLDGRFISLKATDDQETAVKVFKDYDRIALPVTDNDGVLLGIITIDDVLDVAEEEATEDIQKMGGSEALEEPYFDASLFDLVQKRGKWLITLFLGEMLTATAMGHFKSEIDRAVTLALFLPLIISSGGNSGSQAATLIVRALAIGEVTIRDWWRVMKREIISGFLLGLLLGIVGALRVALWQIFDIYDYGPHWHIIALVILFSLIAIVLFGSLTGSMLPLALKKLKIDPASASAPFVATLVDVTGITIYFTIASIFLSRLV